jgi:threonine/homoserine/homoserine lactone efflux protein
MELPMIDAGDISANLVLAYSTYALGTASPGPSNLAVMATAMPAGAQTRDALLVVLGCAVLGLAVFCGYAIAFSTSGARRIYRSLRRWFEGTLAVLFAYAGFRMLASSR